MEEEIPSPPWLTSPHVDRHPTDDSMGAWHRLDTMTPHSHLIPDDAQPEEKSAMGRHIDRWHRP